MIHALTLWLVGLASWYSLPGAQTASGHVFQPRQHLCAMRTHNFGQRLYLTSGRHHSWCRVEDYGPAAWTGRVIDVSPVVAEELHMIRAGVVKVAIYKYGSAVAYHRRTP